MRLKNQNRLPAFSAPQPNAEFAKPQRGRVATLKNGRRVMRYRGRPRGTSTAVPTLTALNNAPFPTLTNHAVTTDEPMTEQKQPQVTNEQPPAVTPSCTPLIEQQAAPQKAPSLLVESSQADAPEQREGDHDAPEEHKEEEHDDDAFFKAPSVAPPKSPGTLGGISKMCPRFEMSKRRCTPYPHQVTKNGRRCVMTLNRGTSCVSDADPWFREPPSPIDWNAPPSPVKAAASPARGYSKWLSSRRGGALKKRFANKAGSPSAKENRIQNALRSTAPGGLPPRAISPEAGKPSIAEALLEIQNMDPICGKAKFNSSRDRKERDTWSAKSLSVGNHHFALEALDLICAEMNPPIITRQRVTMNPQGTYTVSLGIGREGSCTRTMPTLEGATELAARVLVSHLKSQTPDLVARTVEQLREHYQKREASVQEIVEQGPYGEYPRDRLTKSLRVNVQEIVEKGIRTV